jgi:hypothetical protein
VRRDRIVEATCSLVRGRMRQRRGRALRSRSDCGRAARMRPTSETQLLHSAEVELDRRAAHALALDPSRGPAGQPRNRPNVRRRRGKNTTYAAGGRDGDRRRRKRSGDSDRVPSSATTCRLSDRNRSSGGPHASGAAPGGGSGVDGIAPRRRHVSDYPSSLFFSHFADSGRRRAVRGGVGPGLGDEDKAGRDVAAR